MRLSQIATSRRRRLPLMAALALGLLGVVGLGAAPAAMAESCPEPTLSQPFLSGGDTNWYVLVPGQDENGFNGAGWTLSEGASVAPGDPEDGQPASVLDMRSGAEAISPVICITSAYPRGRMMVRNAVGGDGVEFYVSYVNTPSWKHPQKTAKVHGKGTESTLSTPVNLKPANIEDGQLVRFIFVARGHDSDFQIYDFYVDPFCRH